MKIKVFLIAIGYSGQDELPGTMNDMKCMLHFLKTLYNSERFCLDVTVFYDKDMKDWGDVKVIKPTK